MSRKDWEIVIGLEVHAQITSQSKLFSNSSTAFGSDPNTQVDFLDAGMPGMLPSLNKYCVNQAIKTGLGIHGEISLFSVFDRKNYFYPDLPLGYQISQNNYPIVKGGYIDIELESGNVQRIQITRLHLEQDAGKSIHDLRPNYSYIDLNRSGIPLMEIVSEPDMRSSEEAMAFLKKLRAILRYLETCDGNMEKGNLRADANVSVRLPGDPLGTRAEIKNLNSIRFLGQAIEYEKERQISILENGGTIDQETRLFDPVVGETRSMRSKEDSHDYRYFPDPDLRPLRLTKERINSVLLTMPELPDDKKNRLVLDYGLSDYDASLLVAEKERADFYEKIISSFPEDQKKQGAKLAANWLLGEVFAAMNKDNKTLDMLTITERQIASLITLIQKEIISGKIAKTVFQEMWTSGKDPEKIVEDLNLSQITDSTLLSKIITEILRKNSDKVLQYKEGKEQLFGFFVGQVMKETEGKANPSLVNTLLRENLRPTQ